ncbi:MAG: hypothetical protein SNJ75_15680 [Gemmataceae bacterium]
MEPLHRLGLRSRPTLERLEAREVPTVVAPAAPATINDRMVAFLAQNVGKRIGGGECAHVASEALRASGARFIRRPDVVPGDYVWGNLVKVVSNNGVWRDSAPNVRVRPGDLLQYHNVRIRGAGGWTFWTSQHTAVVASVDSLGRPTSVFEQNVNGDRTMRVSQINLSQLLSGRISIYRAEPRVVVPGRFEFSLVNNVNRNAGVVMQAGGYHLGTPVLGPANQWNSYQTRWMNLPVGWGLTLTVGTTTVPVVNGAAYEIFQLPNGMASIRRI